MIFFGSHDGYVYGIQEHTGNTMWRITTGDRVSHSPLVVGAQVLAITDSGGLYSLSAADGSEQWVTSGIRSFVSGNKEHLYCLDRNGRIVVIDTKTGARGPSLMAWGLDVTVANASTDRLIVGTSSGLIQCIREKANHWPQYRDVNQTEVKRKPGQKAKPKKNPNAMPADGDAPAGDDPFAAGDAPAADAPAEEMPAGDDPFGGEGEKKPAMKEDKPAKDDDPFGN